jgi:hypothetical protein
MKFVRIKILNTWTSDADNQNYYNETNCVYENGDYRIFEQCVPHVEHVPHLYVYKNIAFSCLAGLNIEHMENIINREKPTGKYNGKHFLYDRAITTLEKGLNIIANI